MMSQDMSQDMSQNIKKKKITIIARGASTGGSGKVSASIANYLSEAGYRVTYIALVYPEIDYPLDKNVRYIRYAKKKEGKFPSLGKNMFLLRFLRRHKPDVVLSFMNNPVFLASLLVRCKFIFSLRNDPASVNSGKIERLIRHIEYRRASRVVFQTPGARDYFSKKIRKNSVVIGNPVRGDLPYWKNYGKTTAVPDRETKTIISTCRLEKQKNIPMLLNAFAAFSKNHPDYRLQICGAGPLQEKMEDLAAELKIKDVVSFLGFRTDAPELVAAADIFTLTSNFEGLSNSMLEALAIGIPSVCTDCPPGGARLYVNDHENGILVPVNDPDAVVKAWEELDKVPSLGESFSQKSVAIRETLAADTILEQWERVIRESMEK